MPSSLLTISESQKGELLNWQLSILESPIASSPDKERALNDMNSIKSIPTYDQVMRDLQKTEQEFFFNIVNPWLTVTTEIKKYIRELHHSPSQYSAGFFGSLLRVRSQGNLIFEAYHGKARLEDSYAHNVSPDHLFEMASVTKIFTAITFTSKAKELLLYAQEKNNLNFSLEKLKSLTPLEALQILVHLPVKYFLDFYPRNTVIGQLLTHYETLVPDGMRGPSCSYALSHGKEEGLKKNLYELANESVAYQDTNPIILEVILERLEKHQNPSLLTQRTYPEIVKDSINSFFNLDTSRYLYWSEIKDCQNELLQKTPQCQLALNFWGPSFKKTELFFLTFDPSTSRSQGLYQGHSGLILNFKDYDSFFKIYLKALTSSANQIEKEKSEYLKFLITTPTQDELVHMRTLLKDFAIPEYIDQTGRKLPSAFLTAAPISLGDFHVRKSSSGRTSFYSLISGANTCGNEDWWLFHHKHNPFASIGSTGKFMIANLSPDPNQNLSIIFSTNKTAYNSGSNNLKPLYNNLSCLISKAFRPAWNITTLSQEAEAP
ncbi:MAG: serine hydrolase [Bacteriovoracaceae bacterium]|nr:serine hydrolase [Bacteriovoracaceae bacterium]